MTSKTTCHTIGIIVGSIAKKNTFLVFDLPPINPCLWVGGGGQKLPLIVSWQLILETMSKSILVYPKNMFFLLKTCVKACLKSVSCLCKGGWLWDTLSIVNDNIQTCGLNSIAEIDRKRQRVYDKNWCRGCVWQKIEVFYNTFQVLVSNGRLILSNIVYAITLHWDAANCYPLE